MLHRGGTPRRCTHGVGRDKRAASGADWRAGRRAGEMRGQPASRERQAERAERGGRRHRQSAAKRCSQRELHALGERNGLHSKTRRTADAHLSRAGARTLHPGGPSAACTSDPDQHQHRRSLPPRTAPERPLHSRRPGLSYAPCRYQHRAPARHPTLADSPEAACHQLLAASPVPLLAVAAAHCRRCIGRLELPSCDMHSPAPQSHVAPPAMLWHGLRFLSRYEPQQPKRAMFCSSAGCAETSTELVTHCTHFVILTHMP